MDDFANYCFHLYRSQGMLDFRESRGNDDTMSILRGLTPSIRPSLVTKIGLGT